MFKKFSPKEDVSSSTSLKSSVQRHIRTSLLHQLPLLSAPAYREPSSSTEKPSPQADGPVSEEKPDVDQGAAGEDKDGEDEDVGGKSKGKGGKGGKKGKGGGGGGKKGKKDKEKDEEKESGDAAAGDEEVLILDEIWPKKESLGLTKCHDRISIYTVNATPLFFNHFDGPFIPTLKLLHRYPDLLPHVQIDRGAIKFLLAGANMMAPGFLSPGGRLPAGLAEDTLVAIHAEGKEHACGIGKMVASSEEIRKSGKGVAVEVICWVGDDLWKVDSIGL